MAPADQAPQAPAEVDLSTASVARIYDYYLNGNANFAVDREFGKRAVEQFPLIRPMALSNRQWLARMVRAALEAGHRQFLDLGSGVPTAGNVHQIVANTVGHGPGRVVYVDSEPVAVEHSRQVLDREQASGWVGVVQQDYRWPEAVYEHPEIRQVLDLDQPVCLIMASVLQFVGPDDGIADLLATYRQRLVAGSWLAISHPAIDDAGPEHLDNVKTLAANYENTQNPAWLRERGEISAWFDGLNLVEPGLTHAVDWRPDRTQDPATAAEVRPYYWCAVGELPA